MTSSSHQSQRVDPIHGLIVVAIAAILWEVVAWTCHSWNTLSGNELRGRTNCLYQVLRDGKVVGTACFGEEQTPHAILAQVGITCDVLAPRSDPIPCDCAIMISENGRRAQIERIKGAYLLCAGRPIDINIADQEDLEAIPGIGPRLAERIIECREASGPFKNVMELTLVQGIGHKKLGRLAPFVHTPSTSFHPPALTNRVRVASP